MSRERRGLRLARALARELAARRTAERRRDTCSFSESERWAATIQFEEEIVRPSGVRPKTGRAPDDLEPEREEEAELDERA